MSHKRSAPRDDNEDAGEHPPLSMALRYLALAIYMLQQHVAGGNEVTANHGNEGPHAEVPATPMEAAPETAEPGTGTAKVDRATATDPVVPASAESGTAKAPAVPAASQAAPATPPKAAQVAPNPATPPTAAPKAATGTTIMTASAKPAPKAAPAPKSEAAPAPKSEAAPAPKAAPVGGGASTPTAAEDPFVLHGINRPPPVPEHVHIPWREHKCHRCPLPCVRRRMGHRHCACALHQDESLWCIIGIFCYFYDCVVFPELQKHCHDYF